MIPLVEIIKPKIRLEVAQEKNYADLIGFDSNDIS